MSKIQLFAALATIVVPGVAAADILVVRSLGPSAKAYPPGKSIPESAKITLKASDSIVLLDGRGTRTLRGPGTYSAGAPSNAASGKTAVASLGATTQRRARVGAVRSVGTVSRSPTIWHVDISKSSTVCLADPKSVTLWRADAKRPVTMTVTAPDGTTQQLPWTKDSSTLSWPSELSIAEGVDYRLSWSGAPAPTLLRFKWLPAKPAGLEDMAQSLIRNNCQAQLDLLIETFELPAAEPAAAS